MDTTLVVTAQTINPQELELVEVEVLKRHGDWAIVRHESLAEFTVTHVPSGLGLVQFSAGSLETTIKMLHLLPAHPTGFPLMMPQTLEDANEMKEGNEYAPASDEIKAWRKAWHKAWREEVGR